MEDWPWRQPSCWSKLNSSAHEGTQAADMAYYLLQYEPPLLILSLP